MSYRGKVDEDYKVAMDSQEGNVVTFVNAVAFFSEVETVTSGATSGSGVKRHVLSSGVGGVFDRVSAVTSFSAFSSQLSSSVTSASFSAAALLTSLSLASSTSSSPASSSSFSSSSFGMEKRRCLGVGLGRVVRFFERGDDLEGEEESSASLAETLLRKIGGVGRHKSKK